MAPFPRSLSKERPKEPVKQRSKQRSKERASTRDITPPDPSTSYMSSDQFASYLKDLRDFRVNKPGGARPLPDSSRRQSARSSLGTLATVATAATATTAATAASSLPSDSSSLFGASHAEGTAAPKSVGRPSVCGSVSSRHSTMTQGRDYYPERPLRPLKPSEVVPSATYIERGQRWMEKEEAVSLRVAMEDMDLRQRDNELPTKDQQNKDKGDQRHDNGADGDGNGHSNGNGGGDDHDDDEKRIYDAALNEAAELVWQHENPSRVPQPGAPYRYRPHLRINSYAYARTASVGPYGSDVAPTGLARYPGTRSVSGSSTESEDRASPLGLGRDIAVSATDEPVAMRSRGSLGGPRPLVMQGSARRRTSLKRNVSGEVEKPFSGDQICEESEGQTPDEHIAEAALLIDQVRPLRNKAKNPLNRVQFASDVAVATDATLPPSSTASDRPVPPKLMSRTEIYRNPPSQSRNPQYKVNTPSESAQAPGPANHAILHDKMPRKNGVEIRSDDIRQATSMKLKDRSAKLPTPSAVSDSPGRPIVSFDKNWKPPEEATDHNPEEHHSSGQGGFGTEARGISSLRTSPAPTDRLDSQPPEQEQTRQMQQDSGQDWRGQQPQQRRQQQQQQPGDPIIPLIAVSQIASPPKASSRASPPAPKLTQTVTPPVIQVDGPSGSLPVPGLCVSGPDAPPIPSIVLPDGSDDDHVSQGPNIPVIVTPEVGPPPPPSNASSAPRPLPTPQSRGGGGSRSPFDRSRPQGHWSLDSRPQPIGSRATARCHECEHPIEGRFVSLAGSSERFHPQCFRCYVCGTSLEALEISPEPDDRRSARLDRIARRAAGEALPEAPGETMAEDGDTKLRFYCHLDWHELFAPRCKHCKTPILGEHVFALGAHWHQGHFFCAECGDPFDRGQTHIEKDGYAWCVSCQTRRTERRAPKCKKCNTAVIGQYVQALGGEWHDECFRCAVCSGSFDDGQIFPLEGERYGLAPGEMVVLCTGCRERQLKA